MNKLVLFLGAFIALIFGERTRAEFFRSTGLTWEGTNILLQRYLTLPLLGWVMICLMASVYRWSDGWFIIILSLPILVLGTASMLWPAGIMVLVAAYNESDNAKALVNAFAAGLAWIMFVVVMLRIIPIHNDPTYAAGAGLLTVILGLWALNGEAYWSVVIKRWGSRLLAGMIVLVIVILLMGGRDRAAEKFEGVKVFAQTKVSAMINGGEEKAKSDFPSCSDAKDHTFTASGETEKVIALDPNCKTGWHNTLSFRYYYFQSLEKGGLEVEFRDGFRLWIKPNETCWLTDDKFAECGNQHGGVFRFRGEGSVVIRVREPFSLKG